jgi:hypothetical protein
MREIMEQIEVLYPNYGKYTIIELYEILKPELCIFMDNYMRDIRLVNKFEGSCTMKERRMIKISEDN